MLAANFNWLRSVVTPIMSPCLVDYLLLNDRSLHPEQSRVGTVKFANLHRDSVSSRKRRTALTYSLVSG